MQNRIKAALLVGSLAAGSAFAAVSPEQAAELGKTLTPMGAEMAGNADGSIPAWNPKGSPVPSGAYDGVTSTADANCISMEMKTTATAAIEVARVTSCMFSPRLKVPVSLT